jgi:hypothetical protein
LKHFPKEFFDFRSLQFALPPIISVSPDTDRG